MSGRFLLNVAQRGAGTGPFAPLQPPHMPYFSPEGAASVEPEPAPPEMRWESRPLVVAEVPEAREAEPEIRPVVLPPKVISTADSVQEHALPAPEPERRADQPVLEPARREVREDGSSDLRTETQPVRSAPSQAVGAPPRPPASPVPSRESRLSQEPAPVPVLQPPAPAAPERVLSPRLDKAAPEETPRDQAPPAPIEVRIGSVEVRVTNPQRPVQAPRAGAVPQGFGDYALRRRYVQREP